LHDSAPAFFYARLFSAFGLDFSTPHFHDRELDMRKFVGWLGGIASAVITAVLIYHFTAPKPAVPPTTFEGMVIDGAQSVPIKEAMVQFEIEPSATGNGPYHDFTDENGSYKLDVSELPATVKVTLQAQAKGFHESKAVALASLKNDNRTDFVLVPLPTPESTHPGPTPTATPLPTVEGTLPPSVRFHYVPKAVSQRIVFRAAGH
jgi:hypothetical protein